MPTDTKATAQVMEGDVLAYHSNEKLLMLQKPMPTGLNTALTMIRTDNIKVRLLLLLLIRSNTQIEFVSPLIGGSASSSVRSERNALCRI
jgi:hypothetical protein